MYGLLLPLDIKEFSTKEIRIQLSDQNCQNQQNLIFYFLRIPPRFVQAHLYNGN